MHDFAREDELDETAVRARLQSMTDKELAEYGRAGAYLVTPAANHGRPPREAFVVQLRLAREEWRRRKAQSKQSALFDSQREAF